MSRENDTSSMNKTKESADLQHSPKSLYELSLDFISFHADLLESLVGFPSAIGEGIFKRASLKNVLNSSPKTVSVFVTAYSDLVLTSLNLSNSLILINEFFDPLVALTLYIIELDLSCCFLGDKHEFIEVIPNLSCLKKLSLKNNCLTDEAVRKITLPLKMFSRGPTNLEELDLSVNHSITNTSVRWLSRFKNLIFLNLSGTHVDEIGINFLKEKCSMHLCLKSEFPERSVTSKGWAVALLNHWQNICNHQREKIKQTTSSFYRNLRCIKQNECRLNENCVVSDMSKNYLFFKKITVNQELWKMTTDVKKKKSSISGTSTSFLKDIENNLFSQYV